MQIIDNPTIGADIEVFLANKRTREVVSAEGIIKGTKENPYVWDTFNKYFAISLDNVLAEFCIPPARTNNEWYANIQKSLSYINSVIPVELGTMAAPSANLDPKYLRTGQTFWLRA